MSHLIEDETRLHVAGGHLYRLQFAVEECPTPPWEDNEGAVPVVWCDDRDKLRTKGSRGYDLLNPIPYLSDRKLRENLTEIARMWGFWTPGDLDSDARRFYPENTIAEARRLVLAEAYPEFGANEKTLHAMARLWTLAGVPAYVGESRGYSQGDWAAVLAVAHPDAVKAWGFDTMKEYRKACPTDLTDAVRLWGAWCWGGVIGFKVARVSRKEMKLAGLTVEDLDAAALNGLAYCEDVESCWGFYPEHDSDYFPLDKNHKEAIAEAVTYAEWDAKTRKGVAA